MGKIRRLTIYTDKIRKSKKILVYSDLHLGFKNGISIGKILENSNLNSDNYDCILIPGDIVHCTNVVRDDKTKKELLSFLEKLTGSTPTYYILGNHDQYIRNHFEGWECDRTGIVLNTLKSLDNFKILENGLVVNFDDLELKGINMGPSYYLEGRESNEAFLKEYGKISNSDNFSRNTFKILLIHDPKAFYCLSKKCGSCIEACVDLVVSGHMHGALVPNFLQEILKGRGFVSPDYTILPEFSYGVREVGKTAFLVNGALNVFIESEIINNMYGFNCTEVFLEPESNTKKLVYK